MKNLTWALIVLAALGFVGAVVLAVSGYEFMNVAAEGFSRACTNLALLAIALLLVSEKKGSES